MSGRGLSGPDGLTDHRAILREASTANGTSDIGVHRGRQPIRRFAHPRVHTLFDLRLSQIG